MPPPALAFSAKSGLTGSDLRRIAHERRRPAVTDHLVEDTVGICRLQALARPHPAWVGRRRQENDHHHSPWPRTPPREPDCLWNLTTTPWPVLAIINIPTTTSRHPSSARQPPLPSPSGKAVRVSNLACHLRYPQYRARLTTTAHATVDVRQCQSLPFLSSIRAPATTRLRCITARCRPQVRVDIPRPVVF